MVKDIKQFLSVTSKKLEIIEKKIQEMKLNIVIMSFYSDLKIIEDTLLTYQAQGIKINESLFEKVQKFKILLHSNKNLSMLGKKFIEVTEEFYKLRKKIQETDDVNNVDQDEDLDLVTNVTKKKGLDFLSAYV